MRWVLGAVFLLLAGYLLQLELLVYAMCSLLGVILVSRALAFGWLGQVSAERVCNRARVQVGERVAVVLTVRNRGILPVPWLLLEDSLPQHALRQRPPRIKIEGRRLKLVWLKGRSEQVLTYQPTFLMRGYYQLGPLLMESGDLFGLHRRFRLAADPHFILVYPKMISLDDYDVASRRPVGEVQLTHRLFEDPTRISGVRRYQSGDPISRIHWRASARSGQLQSKTFDASTVAGATLLLDFHADGFPETETLHASELMITTVASLANTLLQLGEKCGVVSNGRDAADRVRVEGFRIEFRTRRGARTQYGMQDRSDRLEPVCVPTQQGDDQLTRILEALARLELTDGLSVAELLAESTGRIPRDATVIAVLCSASEETAIALGQLQRRGYSVLVVLVCFDDTRFRESAGRLMAQNLAVRRGESDEMRGELCRQRMVSRV